MSYGSDLEFAKSSFAAAMRAFLTSGGDFYHADGDRMTIAARQIVRDAEGAVYEVATAVRNPRDPMDYDVGRAYALERFEAGQTVYMTEEAFFAFVD